MLARFQNLFGEWWPRGELAASRRGNRCNPTDYKRFNAPKGLGVILSAAAFFFLGDSITHPVDSCQSYLFLDPVWPHMGCGIPRSTEGRRPKTRVSLDPRNGIDVFVLESWGFFISLQSVIAKICSSLPFSLPYRHPAGRPFRPAPALQPLQPAARPKMAQFDRARRGGKGENASVDPLQTMYASCSCCV